MPTEPSFHYPVRVADIPAAGKHILICASIDERAGLAQAFDLAGIDRLDAKLKLSPKSTGDVFVEGIVSADVMYICGVTLEPFAGSINEEVSVRFSVSAEQDLPEELEVTPDMNDPPELITNGMIDLGALVSEFLALGLEIYPRKPDAALDPALSKPAAEDHPFAALAGLVVPLKKDK